MPPDRRAAHHFVRISSTLFLIMNIPFWSKAFFFISAKPPHIATAAMERIKRGINLLLSLPCSSLCVLQLRGWAWRGTKAADSGTSWTDPIGCSHQTTAAASWGMNKCGVWWCEISCFTAILFSLLHLLVLFSVRRQSVSGCAQCLNNEWDIYNVEYIMMKISGNTLDALKFNCW